MIDMNKKYKTRSGLPVRVLCIDAKNTAFPVVTLIAEKNSERVETYTSTGNAFIDYKESTYDLIEVSPYEDFKVDDLCVVTSSTGTKRFRYFAEQRNNIAYCFDMGRTSITGNEKNFWEQCRKATPEEIATKTIKD